MPTKRSSWPQFTGAEVVQWQLFADGTPAGYADLPGTATQQEFFIGAGIEPMVEVRPLGFAVGAMIEDIGGGSGNGGGG